MRKGMLASGMALLVGSLFSFSVVAQTPTYCVPEGPRVALTFDDGPWKNHTPEVLNILQDKGVLATFFVVGQRVRAAPDTLRLQHELGHEIGLHTDDHQSLVKLSPIAQNAEIQRNYDAVKAVLPDLPIKLWRAPYGAIPKPYPSVVRDLDLHHVGWSVDSEDWRKPGEAVFYANIFNRIKDGSIILMHEHTVDTRHLLPHLIDTLKTEGYQFVVVSDLHAPTCPVNLLENQPELVDPQEDKAPQNEELW